MLDPQVWDEEGLVISQIVGRGFASLCQPVNGYLLVLPRLLSLVAMLVPFSEYPRVVTMLAWVATLAMLIAVAFVPSRLRGGPLLALAALLVPSDAEIFGLALYTFWWSALLLCASAFWENGRRTEWLRLTAIFAGGLSSPVIILVTPLFVLAALGKDRDRTKIAAAIAAFACALAQIAVLVQARAGGGLHLTFTAIRVAIAKFAGGYLVWNGLAPGTWRDNTTLVIGALSVCLLIVVYRREAGLRSVLAWLTYLWLGSIALSIARVDAGALDQALAGPRYFFLPFFIESWILIQIALSASSLRVRRIAAAILICAAFNALPVLSRSHDDLAWKASISACSASPNAAPVSIPIQYDGHAASHWVLQLTGRECSQLSRFGLAGLWFLSTRPGLSWPETRDCEIRMVGQLHTPVIDDMPADAAACQRGENS